MNDPLFYAPTEEELIAILFGLKTEFRLPVVGYEPCPYKPGDKIKIQESYWFDNKSKNTIAYKINPQYFKYKDKPKTIQNAFRLGEDFECVKIGEDETESDFISSPNWVIKGAHSMPAWATRIAIEVESVSIQQIKNVSRSDIRAEGWQPPRVICNDDISPNYRDWLPMVFRQHWMKRYGPDSWFDNVTVWVIKFKVPKPLFTVSKKN